MPTLKPDGRRLNGKGSKWITPKRRLAIYRRDGWRCRYCGKSLRSAKPHQRTLDHVVPVARGGTHASRNLRMACKPCNDRKQHRHVRTFQKKGKAVKFNWKHLERSRSAEGKTDART